MSDIQQNQTSEAPATGISVSHIVHTLRAYLPVIFLSLGGIAVGYFIIAIALYLRAPSQTITSQQFRLDFEGAENGNYPNGLKFSREEIVSPPILLRVFEQNHLSEFTTFNDFAHATFVLEANAEYERLAAEYQSRMLDTKLSPVDRERIRREWEARAAAVAKNDYSINFLRTRTTNRIPETLVRKILTDILAEWAQYAIRDRRVLNYHMAVLSANLLRDDEGDRDLIVDLQILRAKVSRVIENVRVMSEIPGALLIRTTKERLSLEEIRVRLEELVRYRIEPLVGVVRSAGLVSNPAATMRFLETQLAYDQRILRYRQDDADGIRQSLAVYAMQDSRSQSEAPRTTTAAPDKTPRASGPQETVMPQISDSFIDRLLSMTNLSGDLMFRQKLVTDYRRAAANIVPAQMNVDYDQEVIASVRNATPGTTSAQADNVRAEMVATRNEVRSLIANVNEIFEAVSRNLNPSTELYTLTAPPRNSIERTGSLPRLMLYGILVLLLSLPVIIALALLHARIREEETEEGYVTPVAT
jgi:tetrahydromethanopterin S-methyltransferase subunit B